MATPANKPFLSSYEDYYFRATLVLAGLLYFTLQFAGSQTGPMNYFLIPATVMAVIPVLAAAGSIFVEAIRSRLRDITAVYYMGASLHVVGLLSVNDTFPHDAWIIFSIIFFTNLHLTRFIQIVIYNITMLAVIEYVFITTGFGKGIHPIAFFIILVLVIFIGAAYQLFRIRSAAAGQERENILSDLVANNPDAWLVFEGNGLIAREAGVRALELFSIRDRSELSTFSLRNIITAGSPFEADRIIRNILDGEKVELRTLCRKPSGELFWTELAVFRIPGSENDFFCRFFDISEFLNSREIANATAIRYRSYLDTMSEGLIIADQQLRINLANHSASVILGSPISTGVSLETIFDDEALLRFQSALSGTSHDGAISELRSGMLLNGTTCNYQFKVETEPVDQTTELVIYLYKEAANEEPVMAHVATDQGSIMQLFQSGAVPACTVDLSGHFLMCNPAFATVSGYSTRDLGLLTLENLVHPDNSKAVKKLLHPGFDEPQEIHILSGEGKDKWLRVSGVQADGGKIRILLWEDITDLIIARAELEQTGSRITAVIENTQSPVAAIDFNHRITFMNRAFQYEFMKRTGRNPVTGDDYRTLLDETGKAKWEQLYSKVMTGERHFEDEGISYPDGKRAWFESSYTPVTLPGGIVSGITLFMREVTDRITFQNDLVQARNQAEAATKAKSGFLATMSHEIRTPLNGLLGMTELLTSTVLNPEQKGYLDSIRVSGEALLSIINDVLDYSKIESEMMTLEQKPFSISATIRETFDMLRYRANEKGNRLISNVEQQLPDIISGDKVRLRQVLLNLTGNAIKFTQNGTIGIDVKQLQRSGDDLIAEFTVSDTGIGIPADKMDRLFKSFSQAEESTFSQYGGTGLGLAISAKLVSLMGGQIRAESEHGKGSRFIFTIRTKAAVPVQTEIQPPAETPKSAPVNRAVSILVAEDNPVNQKVAKAMLEKMGHQVTVVPDGKQALEAAVTGQFPVIFMDVQMPEMNGYDSTRKIREQLKGKSQPVIIAMTAQALEGDREACLAAGMDDYIPKPVSAAAFEEKIKLWGGQSVAAAPSVSSPPALSNVLDQEIIGRLRDLADDDQHFLANIIRLYKDQSTETLSELEKQMKSGNVNAVWQAAHKLKGASLNLGARETGEWCSRIEEASKGGTTDAYPALLDALKKSYHQSVSALEALLK